MGDYDLLISEVLKINAIVGTVLYPDAIERWWDTTIPSLSLRTPTEVLEDGEFDVLLEYVQSYQDPSFS